MSFESIESFLKKGLKSAHAPTPDDAKVRVHEECRALLAKKRESIKEPWWSFCLKLIKQKVVLGALVVSGVFLFFGFPGSWLAPHGKIYPTQGLVKVIRDDQTLLMTNVSRLEIGDVVQVGSSAQAQIIFPGALDTIIYDNTSIRVIDHGDMYVQQGHITANMFNSGSVTTNRGIIQSEDGIVRVWVSETGETKVVVDQNQISVFDWNNGEQVLSAGEEIRLRTDTLLTDITIPPDLTLSLDQILALRSKLAIARSKAVSGLEQLSIGNAEQASRSFEGAYTTYKTMYQVLQSSRDLSFITRKNIASVEFQDVLIALQDKEADNELIQEATALKRLFVLQNQYPEHVFEEQFTGVNTFDRYRLVDRLFALGTEEDQLLGEVLKQKYVVAFLQDIQNEELLADQVRFIDSQMVLLPQTETTKRFLSALQGIADPVLADEIASLFKAL